MRKVWGGQHQLDVRAVTDQLQRRGLGQQQDIAAAVEEIVTGLLNGGRPQGDVLQDQPT